MREEDRNRPGDGWFRRRAGLRRCLAPGRVWLTSGHSPITSCARSAAAQEGGDIQIVQIKAVRLERVDHFAAFRCHSFLLVSA